MTAPGHPDRDGFYIVKKGIYAVCCLIQNEFRCFVKGFLFFDNFINVYIQVHLIIKTNCATLYQSPGRWLYSPMGPFVVLQIIIFDNLVAIFIKALIQVPATQIFSQTGFMFFFHMFPNFCSTFNKITLFTFSSYFNLFIINLFFTLSLIIFCSFLLDLLWSFFFSRHSDHTIFCFGFPARPYIKSKTKLSISNFAIIFSIVLNMLGFSNVIFLEA